MTTTLVSRKHTDFCRSETETKVLKKDPYIKINLSMKKKIIKFSQRDDKRESQTVLF